MPRDLLRRIRNNHWESRFETCLITDYIQYKKSESSPEYPVFTDRTKINLNKNFRKFGSLQFRYFGTLEPEIVIVTLVDLIDISKLFKSISI